MIRKLIAVAAVSGSLALGAVGVAGASTPTPTPSLTPAPSTLATKCAKAEKLVPVIQAGEAKAAAWVTKAQANEAKATGAEHTKLAARIAKRISRVQKLETRGNTLLAKIAAKCGGTTGSSSGTGSASST
jgi:hypothetical protein